MQLPLAHAQSPAQFNGAKALEYARQFVACGPRFNGSAGLLCAQNYLKKQFAHDDLQADTFVASTPAGPQQMTNFIVRFPGKKDGIIVLATHYETNYWLRTTSFVGANDGAATTGLLLEDLSLILERVRMDPKAFRLLGTRVRRLSRTASV